MNKEKLLKLADAIEGADQSRNSEFAFDMECFYSHRRQTSHPCGTAACIQGWAEHTDPDDDAWQSFDLVEGFQIWAGIDDRQAAYICMPGDTHLIKQEHAVAMLRHFVETGEVVWDAEGEGEQIMTNARGKHRKVEGDANAERIKAIIADNPYARPKDIIEATGLHPVTVSRHLRKLRDKAKEGRSDG